jgi:hypothetical protein
MIQVDGWRFDERNVEKLSRRGITPEQLEDVLDEENYVVERNRKHRAAPHRMIGLDANGNCLTIPMTATDEPGVWRPVTAWYCKASEWVRLPKAKE